VDRRPRNGKYNNLLSDYTLVLAMIWLKSVHVALNNNHSLTCQRFRFLVFNATFNNISVISWWSVLLVEKTTEMSQITACQKNISSLNFYHDLNFAVSPQCCVFSREVQTIIFYLTILLFSP
jgi:hypothetical protein